MFQLRERKALKCLNNYGEVGKNVSKNVLFTRRASWHHNQFGKATGCTFIRNLRQQILNKYLAIRPSAKLDVIGTTITQTSLKVTTCSHPKPKCFRNCSKFTKDSLAWPTEHQKTKALTREAAAARETRAKHIIVKIVIVFDCLSRPVRGGLQPRKKGKRIG